MTEVSTCARNWLERLSPELRLTIFRLLPRDALVAFSETCSFSADATRSLRLGRIIVSDRSMGALQHWLSVGAALCGCQCSDRQICRIDNRSCRAVVIICPKQRSYFAAHVDTLVFPTTWTPECVELVRLVGELGPLRLRSVDMKSTGHDSWWENATVALAPHAVGGLFAASPTLTIVNPSTAGLFAIFTKYVPSRRGKVASKCGTLEIRGRPSASQSTTGWGGGGWADADDIEGEGEAGQKVAVQTQQLLVELGTGLERALAGVFFFDLSILTLVTQSTAMDWSLANKLLSDSRNKLERIDVRRGLSGPWDEPLAVEALPVLVAVNVDWALIGCLRNIEGCTPPRQVNITVHGFDADAADEHAYARAREVLPSDHWRSVAIEEDEFWKLPEAAEGRLLRRSRLLQEMGAGFNPDFI